MERLSTRPAPSCPCCCVLDANDLAHQLSLRRSEDSLIKCKLCEIEMREQASSREKEIFAAAKKAGSKSNNKNAHKASGGGSSGSKHSSGGKQSSKAAAILEAAKIAQRSTKPATFVCLTCAFACCVEHAISHFMESGKKRSTKQARHVEHHCVFLNVESSAPEVQEFSGYCVACDLAIGNMLMPENTDYSDCIDGYCVNAEGYNLDQEDYLTEPSVVIFQALERIQEAKANGGGSGGRMGKKMKLLLNSKNSAQQRKIARAEKRKRDRENQQGGTSSSGGGNWGERTKNPEIQEQGIVGFQNLGNTCFFNSTLQCLLQLPQVRDGFGFLIGSGGESRDLPGPLSIALHRTINSVTESPTGAVIAPRTLFSQLCSRNPIFAEFGQQDANELFHFIVGGVADEYEVRRHNNDIENKITSNSASASSTTQQEHHHEQQQEQQQVLTCFGGEISVSITCHKCKTVSQKSEKVHDLNLPVSNCISVVEALRLYFSPQIMDEYICEKCNKEEFELQKKMEDAQRREREELAKRLMTEMEAQGGFLAQDENEIVKVEEGDDDDDEEEEEDDEEDDEEEEKEEGEEPSDNTNNNNAEAETQQQKEQQQQTTDSKSEANEKSPEKDSSSDVAADSAVSKSATEEKQQEEKKEETTTTETTTTTTTDVTSSSPCSPSSTHSKATFESSISSLKDVLVLHLKRFSLNWQKQCWEKNTAPISYTSTIDLSEFAPALASQQQQEQEKQQEEKRNDNDDNEQNIALLMSAFPQKQFSQKALRSVLEAAGNNVELAMELLQSGIQLESNNDNNNTGNTKSNNNNENNNSVKYRLTGIVEHSGSVNSGHYISYIKSMRSSNWYKCSDSFVRSCQESDALNAQAYMLFYQRQ